MISKCNFNSLIQIQNVLSYFREREEKRIAREKAELEAINAAKLKVPAKPKAPSPHQSKIRPPSPYKHKPQPPLSKPPPILNETVEIVSFLQND